MNKLEEACQRLINIAQTMSKALQDASASAQYWQRRALEAEAKIKPVPVIRFHGRH